MSDDENSPSLANGFIAVRRELVRRTVRPASEVVYWTYFILCIVILGTLAIWLEYLRLNGLPPDKQDWHNIYTSIVTFFPVLVGSSCVQMMFESGNRRIQAFSLFTCVVALIAGAVLITTARPVGTCSWTVAIVISLLSLWVWWIANADNKSLHDTPPDDASVGGDPTAPLSGGYDGIKV